MKISDPAWQSGLRMNHRRDIRRLKSRGFTVETNDWDRLRDFVAVYGQTMYRLGAEGRYMFSDDFFLGLRDKMRHKFDLVFSVSPGGETAAAGLFSVPSTTRSVFPCGYGARVRRRFSEQTAVRRGRQEGGRTRMQLLSFGWWRGGRVRLTASLQEGVLKTHRYVLDDAFCNGFAAVQPIGRRWFANRQRFFPAYRRSVET